MDANKRAWDKHNMHPNDPAREEIDLDPILDERLANLLEHGHTLRQIVYGKEIPNLEWGADFLDWTYSNTEGFDDMLRKIAYAGRIKDNALLTSAAAVLSGWLLGRAEEYLDSEAK